MEIYTKSESSIERDIIYYLNHIKKIFCFKLRDQIYCGKDGKHRRPPFGCIKGQPDLCVFFNGRVDWLEVKTPKGRQSPHQKKFQEECIKNGINYFIVRDFKDVMKIYE